MNQTLASTGNSLRGAETQETKFTLKVSKFKNAIIFAGCMEEMQLRIIEQSMEMFLKFGIRSVTMDDVARELGVSKKTLYKYVSNKADLILQGVQLKFGQITEMMLQLNKEVDNAIDELFAIDAHFDEVMKQYQPAIMFQMAKYYPETFKWLDERKSDFIVGITKANLKKGVAQGMYRKHLNVEYVSYIYAAHASLGEEGSVVPNELCHSPEFHKHHLEYHIRGIASAKGLEYLNQKLNTK